MFRTMSRVFIALMVVSLTAVASLAQQPTASTETKKFEVLAVDGNRLVVRLPEGTRELTVPETFRFDIEGKQLSVRELKPGMSGTATITKQTTVTPVTVTEVKNGTVMQASGPSIIVRTDTGIKMFTQGDIDKRGVKIMRDGRPAQISDFREGDRLTATIITTKPPQVMTETQVKATLDRAAAAGAPPAAAAPAPSARPSSVEAPAAPAGEATSGATRKLPRTASSWPVVGLASVLSLALGLALTIRRRSVQ